MSLPKQASPVTRQQSLQNYAGGKVAASDRCGCPIACIGPCILGSCTGICI